MSSHFIHLGNPKATTQTMTQQKQQIYSCYWWIRKFAEITDMQSSCYTSAGSGLSKFVDTGSGVSKFVATGAGVSKFVATILHTGILSFLLSSFNDGWTSTSRMHTLSPISRLLKSTSIFGGMCSAGQRYFRVVLILFKWPPVLAWE